MNRDDELNGVKRVPRQFMRPMGAGSEVRKRERKSGLQPDGSYHFGEDREQYDADSDDYHVNGAKMKANLHSWIVAKSFFERHRRGSEAKLGHNTVLREVFTGERGSEDVQVVLHDTPIVTFHADGTLTLNSGGWHSVTTKARINEILPMHIQIQQIKGTWWVVEYAGRGVGAVGPKLKFFDGMRIRLNDDFTR
jgi:hypothetical protein